MPNRKRLAGSKKFFSTSAQAAGVFSRQERLADDCYGQCWETGKHAEFQ